jgi:hypothetical protein
MITEVINQTRTNHGRTARIGGLFPVFIGFVFALALCPARAHAQIIGGIEVTIPFQFYAGNAKLPAGKYVIRTVDNTDLTFMEISSADGSTSALFEVREAEANSSPAKSEVIFKKYGDRYFLAKLFDESNPNGSAVSESRYEKSVGEAAAESEAHIPAHRKGQQGG